LLPRFVNLAYFQSRLIFNGAEKFVAGAFDPPLSFGRAKTSVTWIATGYQRCCDLDHWIRRRVRMAYWRQWRKTRTKMRSLMRLGVHVQSAVACGITSKGPWRSSKTPGIQQALSNDYLKVEGFVSLRDGWIRLHHSR
jgi:hypothetical protein